ncbi:outer membrane protein [Humitalea rosea]|uniref:Outer membrane protein n=2 Tax=Humitalea rosea TaxID=990373 RepID=A0A2W7ITU1_9PROT|nr:outer membrane protein [Humitalea rosea]
MPVSVSNAPSLARMPRALGILALLLVATPAGAQTLQEALAATYANNPTLRSARAQLRVVDENVPQALAGWRPTVSLSTSYGTVVDSNVRSRVTGANGNQFGSYSNIDRDPFSAQATVSQPLYRGGRTRAQTRRAENQVLAQRARVLGAEQQALGDAISAYVQVIRFQEEVRLNVNNVQVLTRQLEATNERFRVGEITRTDVAQAESRLAGARATRADSEGSLQSARATFQRVIGIAPTRLSAPQPLAAAARTAQEAATSAAGNNPAVVAALFDEAAARDQIDVQVSALLPQASLNATSFRNDNSSTPGNRITGEQLTATLTVPLYQGGAEYSAVRQARQDAVRLRSVVDDQRRTAISQATSAWETLASNRAQVESVRAQIRAAEIALDGVQREAIVGSRTTLDVLNAEQELLTARVSLVRALANVVTASHSLAASIGRLTAQDLALPVQAYDMTEYYGAVRNRWVGFSDPTAGR